MATTSASKKTTSAKKSGSTSAKKQTPSKSANASKKTTASKKTSNRKVDSGTAEPALLELFIDEIKDIYWAEKHLLKVLPKMQKAATSEKLKSALGDHLEQTKVQVERLEQVFELLGEKAQAKKCEAMAGLAEEGNSIIEETEKGSSTRDAGIILACQKVEHYEIATYGVLATLAKVMGHTDIKKLLGATLDEEKNADKLLTQIAEGSINFKANQES